MDSTIAVSPSKGSRPRFPAWLAYSLLTILLWGVWGALTKSISSDIDAYTNQVLFALGVLPVMAVVLFSGRLSGGVRRRRGAFYAFITGILGGAGNVAFFMAFTHGGKASVVVPATSLSPLVTVILGYFLLGERATGWQKLGLALAMVSIYLLSL